MAIDEFPTGPRLIDMLGDPNEEKATRTTEAMFAMTKLDIAALEKAYAGEYATAY